MANYTLANLVKAQIKLNGDFANNDTRFRVPENFLSLVIGAETFFPSYKTLKTSDTRAVEANYFKRTASALATSGRAHNHTGDGGDSGVLSLSWTTYSSKFSMTLKQADTSVFSWQEEFNNEIKNTVANFADGLDAVAVDFLFSNRSGVNPASVKGSFNATNDTYEIVEADYADESIMITKVVMDINKYQGRTMNIHCDSIAYTTFLKQAAQGAQNATNLSFQFMGTNFIHAPQLTEIAVNLDAGYTKGFWLAVPQNHVAVADWTPVQNRLGVETSVNIYGALINPVDGLQYAVHAYETRADGTSVNGQKQDVLTQTEVSIDLTFNYAPSSVADETPIQAFALIEESAPSV